MSDQISPINPMIVPLDYFTLMRNLFMGHYYLVDCNPNFGGQEIQLPWNSLSLAISSFMSANDLGPESIALRFVHCYDSVQNVLYLRMQILTMQPIQGEPRKFTLIDTISEWYELTNGTLNPTKNTDLFDEEYMKYFYYCSSLLMNCNPRTLDNLSNDKEEADYARTVTYPWLEMSALYTDNNDPSNAILCIDAASRLTLFAPQVKFQHCLVMYLRKQDGTPMLNNDMSGAPFYYKAADYGTMCPPDCGIYILPAGARPR